MSVGTRLFVWILAASSCGAPAKAATREEVALEVIQQTRQQERELQSTQASDLHANYLSAGYNTQNMRLINLALGAHYLESSPRLALQYLTAAELSCQESDPLLPMVRYYLAEAKYRGGAYHDAAELSASLATQDFGDTWAKRVQSLLIESLYSEGNFEQLTSAFKEFSNRFSFSRRQEVLARMATEAFEKRGDRRDAADLLEQLARNYPATEESRWAFKKLEDATCESKGEHRYIFSEKLLLHLSRNVVLNTGLEQFIVAALDRAVVDENGRSHLLTPAEKAEFFVKAHMFHYAFDVLHDWYEEEKAKASLAVPNLMVDLARVLLRQFQPNEAKRYLTDFLIDYPKHPLHGRVLEMLGDALRYVGQPLAAANSYATALNGRDSQTLRWMYFWSLYRGKDFAGALSLVEKPGYVTPREGDEPYIINYWHARILEHLHKQNEANGIFAEILNRNGNSFYASMVALRHPELTRSALAGSTPLASNVEATGQPVINLAARSLAARAGLSAETPPTRNDLKFIIDLLNVGLKDAAAAQLGLLKWTGFNAPDSFAAITKLSTQLDDYRPSRNLRFTSFSNLRTLPHSWDDILRLQAQHPDEWKVYYPLAYERILKPMAARMRLNPLFVLSIMRAESSYNKEARSGVGAQGLMQLMPYTALKIATLLHDEEFDIRDIAKPEISIGYGIYYLDRLLRYYGDNPFLAAAAYNGGPAVVNQWLGTCSDCAADEFVDSIPYHETRRYVREVLHSYDTYSRIYTGKPALAELPEMPSNLPEDEIF